MLMASHLLAEAVADFLALKFSIFPIYFPFLLYATLLRSPVAVRRDESGERDERDERDGRGDGGERELRKVKEVTCVYSVLTSVL